MGNFSRDPDTRADFAVSKQYVAVRLQQGVPILDADWNLLDDLRRRDTETLGGQFIGDGVPTGSDGFRIFQVGAPDPSLGKQDFGIRQGLIIVNGKLLQTDKDFRYTDQPNFNNPAVTPRVEPLELRKEEGEFEYVIFLDTWEREVDSQGEETLVDPHIGIETAVLLKREWAVRVILREDFSAPPSGHFFYALAKLNWIGGSNDITDDMLAELRDTDASPRREIAYRRGKGPDPLVDTKMFLETLQATRDSISDFLLFLTTKFVSAAVPYSAAEVIGFHSLRAIASLADYGIALVNARALDTRGAILLFAQLFETEKRFLGVWNDALLPLVTTNGKYVAFTSMIEAIQTFLLGSAPAGFLAMAEALKIADELEGANLREAQRSQDQINLQFGFNYTFTIETKMRLRGGVFQKIHDGLPDPITFHLHNNTSAATQVALDFTPKGQDGWEIRPPAGVDLSNQSIPSQGLKDYEFNFVIRDGQDGQKLVFKLTADANEPKLAEVKVTIIVIPFE